MKNVCSCNACLKAEVHWQLEMHTADILAHVVLLNPYMVEVQVWEASSKKLKLDLPGHADEVFSVDWSPNGASVASGGKDHVLRLWRH